MSISNTNSVRDRYILFWREWGNHGVFSQWFKSPFVCDGMKFSTAEQFMMYGKARIAGDIEYQNTILNTPDAHPREHKRMGRSVRNLDINTWENLGMDVVTIGNLCKFTQSDQLRNMLLETGTKTLVETNPHDRIWGIGYDDIDALKHTDSWGQNKLGKVLMRVRDMIMQSPMTVVSTSNVNMNPDTIVGTSTQMSTIPKPIMNIIETVDHEPYIIKRKIRDGAIIRGIPMVVKCVWTPLNVKNLITKTATLEDVQRNRPCDVHPYCMGPQYINANTGAFLITNGFAKKDEIISSDSNILNQGLVNGDRIPADAAKHCYDKIATKNGILRKQNNGCRPLNSNRLVASPLEGIRFGDVDMHEMVPMGWVELPRRVMNRARYMYVAEDGKCSMRKIEEGECIVIGRCPSQGPESTVPVRVRPAPPGVNSIRTPLELCELTNLDFDGDEVWEWVPMTLAGKREMEERWRDFWITNPPRNVFRPVYDVAVANSISPKIDPAVLTTMTFKEMSMHKGGKMYDSMLLKPKTWKQMYSVMVSPTYWKTCVTRGKAGMMNAVVSRHGLAGPYGFMRTGMMLGTCVSTIDGMIRVDSMRELDLPSTMAPVGMIPLACSTALTKMTKVMYQKGIDMSKHGSARSKPVAIDTLMGVDPGSYIMYPSNGGMGITYHPGDRNTDLSMHTISDTYTKMAAIVNTGSAPKMIEMACVITSLIEEIDNVNLTAAERVMVSYFFSFLSKFINQRPVVNKGMVPIELIIDLGLDWYTSVTCSDVRWFRDIMRNPNMRGRLNMSTDITSVLGSIFIGNMSMTAPGTVVRSSSKTVAGSVLSRLELQPGDHIDININTTVSSITNMCKSQNKVCKICTTKITNWETCPEFDKFAISTNDMDVTPGNFDWIERHGSKDIKMTHDFIIVMCTSCNSRGGEPDRKALFSTISNIASTYAGNITVRVAGNKTVLQWVKHSHGVKNVSTDTETESEIDENVPNNQLQLVRKGDDDDGSSSETESESDSDTETERGMITIIPTNINVIIYVYTMCKYIHDICPFIMEHDKPYEYEEPIRYMCQYAKGHICDATKTAHTSICIGILPPHPDYTMFKVCKGCTKQGRKYQTNGIIVSGKPLAAMDYINPNGV
ncbi:hypothetical protein MY10362_009155 [Beauveria mimosiformis]